MELRQNHGQHTPLMVYWQLQRTKWGPLKSFGFFPGLALTLNGWDLVDSCGKTKRFVVSRLLSDSCVELQDKTGHSFRSCGFRIEPGKPILMRVTSRGAPTSPAEINRLFLWFCLGVFGLLGLYLLGVYFERTYA